MCKYSISISSETNTYFSANVAESPASFDINVDFPVPCNPKTPIV